MTRALAEEGEILEWNNNDSTTQPEGQLGKTSADFLRSAVELTAQTQAIESATGERQYGEDTDRRSVASHCRQGARGNLDYGMSP